MSLKIPATVSSIPTNQIETILQTALDAANPYSLVKDNLQILDNSFLIGGIRYSVSPATRIITLGLGKAAPQMTRAANEVLGQRVSSSVCVCKHQPANNVGLETTTMVEAGHPVPDERSVKAGMMLKTTITDLHEEDLVIVLLSGGGSALACLPGPGIKLEDIQAVTKILLKNGATINEMNVVRKHLDLIKGGGLLRMASPARMTVLVLSDVVGSPLETIASGPAIIDPSTYQDALNVLERYAHGETINDAVISHLKSRSISDVAVKRGGFEGEFSAHHKVIGSSDHSVDAAAKKAEELGFHTQVITYALTGEARQAGKLLVEAWEQCTLVKPFLLLAGGETTVRVKGNGMGGRNLEVALGAVERIRQLKGIALVTLATDGEDGPTDAAGAIVTPDTFKLAGEDGRFLQHCLDANDSYRFFEKAGSLIKTGPTGTNVNDISFVFGY